MRFVLTANFILAIISLYDQSSCHQLPDFYWNSSSTAFLESRAAMVKAEIGDRLNIFCPHYPLGDSSSPAEEDAYLEIYRVPKQGFDQCSLRFGSSAVGVCTTPSVVTTVTLVIREFTANPSGLEYKPGRRYYFISTSNGSRRGLANANGGLCHWRNMKMTLHVIAQSQSRSTRPMGDLGPTKDEYFLITYHQPADHGDHVSNQPQVTTVPTTTTRPPSDIWYVVHTDAVQEASGCAGSYRLTTLLWSLVFAHAAGRWH